ncbi:MAG: hypothetical protein WC884_03815 [Candidatus Paceibacterota bacterium]
MEDQASNVALNTTSKYAKLHTIAKILLLLFSTYITIALIEFAFKGILPSKEKKLQDYCAGFNGGKFLNSQNFAQLNAYYQPLDEVGHCDSEWRYTYHIDENGFRSNGKSTRDSTTLAIGDSFTFGFGVEDNQSFPALLNAYNAGLWANTFNNQLLSLKRNLEIVKPKVVIWSFYPPHVITMMPNDWSASCPGDFTYFKGNSFDSNLFRELTRRYFKPLSEKSYFVKYLLNKENITEIIVDNSGVKVTKNCYSTKEILLYDKNLVNNEYTNDPEVNKTFLTDLDGVYKKIQEYLVEASDLSKEYDAKFYFAIIPSRLSLTISEGKYKSPYKGSDIDTRLPVKNFIKLIVNAGFDENQIIDLTDSFLETDNWGDYYFVEDAHWNAKGHEFVAKTLKDKIGL